MCRPTHQNENSVSCSFQNRKSCREQNRNGGGFFSSGFGACPFLSGICSRGFCNPKSREADAFEGGPRANRLRRPPLIRFAGTDGFAMTMRRVFSALTGLPDLRVVGEHDLRSHTLLWLIHRQGDGSVEMVAAPGPRPVRALGRAKRVANDQPPSPLDTTSSIRRAATSRSGGIPSPDGGRSRPPQTAAPCRGYARHPTGLLSAFSWGNSTPFSGFANYSVPVLLSPRHGNRGNRRECVK